MQRPELYVEHGSFLNLANERLLNKYFNNIKWKNESASVLDIGCGDGFSTVNVLLPKLPKNSTKLIGCDISEKMINYANKKYMNQENIRFVTLDIGKNEITKDWEEKYDHVFSFLCLHFVNLRVAFQNIFNMLQPNGDLLVWYIYKSSHSHALFNLSKYPRWKQYFSKEAIKAFEVVADNTKSPEQMACVLQDIGYANYFCKMEELNHNFDDLQTFTRFLESIDLIAHSFKHEDEKAEYFKDYINELRSLKGFKFTPNPNGGENVLLTFHLLVVYASKSV